MNLFALAKASIGLTSTAPSTTQNISIAKTSNPQAQVEPSGNIFDLNTYWNQGYRDDSEEGNKAAARVIRQDIMTQYGIEDDDANKEEKLTRIYLDIIEDSGNDILIKNYQDSGIIYDGTNDEEFIEGFEMTMAHMTHDGTGKGDKISLTEVDFSDIEYRDEAQTGSIETNILSNGVEYVVYGSYGDVIKCISQTTDESGLTTIATYADNNKTNLISSDIAFITSNNDNQIKFIFGSGSQNTVNFEDNGNDISVEVSRGALREEYTVEKNDDGTFCLDGKQYFTIEEIATEMNSRELTDNGELDGIIGTSEQGHAGICGTLSGINSLSTNDYGEEAIKNAVTFDDEGNATVYFAGVDMTYTVTKADYKKYQNFTKKFDPEVMAIAIANELLLKDLDAGKVQRNNTAPFYIFGQNDVNRNASRNNELSRGTYPSQIYYLLTGKLCNKYTDLSTVARLDELDRMENKGDIAICVANLAYIYEFASSNETPKNPENVECQDAFGNDVTILAVHHYAVKESNTRADGTRLVTIINPWDSSQEIVLDEDTFLRAFNATFDVDFTRDENFGPYYELSQST